MNQSPELSWHDIRDGDNRRLFIGTFNFKTCAEITFTLANDCRDVLAALCFMLKTQLEDFAVSRANSANSHNRDSMMDIIKNSSQPLDGYEHVNINSFGRVNTPVLYDFAYVNL